MLAAAYAGAIIASFGTGFAFMLRGGLIYGTILHSVNDHPQTDRKFPLMFGNWYVSDVLKSYALLYPDSDLRRRMYRNYAISVLFIGIALLLLFYRARAGA